MIVLLLWLYQLMTVYQLQLKIDELSGENLRLEEALADKRLRLSRAGNIAEAALEMNDCLRSVQQAADQYLEEIKTVLAETEQQREQILADARAEAAEILASARKTQGDYDSAIEAILQEYGQDQTDNG